MSDEYQIDTIISLEDVHYSPLCPGEKELGILGDVAGKNILELACGGAQNSIALSKWGAHTTAVDFSNRQLSKAKKLVKQEKARVELVLGDIEHLNMFKDSKFDIILSSFGWEFVTNLKICLMECRRMLRMGGLLIIATVHPLAAFEWDQQYKNLMVTNYFNPPIEVWEDTTSYHGQKGLTFFHTIEEMFELITSSGFTIESIKEPYPYPIFEMNELEKRLIPYTGRKWEQIYERLSKVPFSIIYKARKSK